MKCQNKCRYLGNAPITSHIFSEKKINKMKMLSVAVVIGAITKTYLYYFEPLKPHLYIVKLGFTGVYIIFLISAQRHRLWVLIRTALVRF